MPAMMFDFYVFVTISASRAIMPEVRILTGLISMLSMTLALTAAKMER